MATHFQDVVCAFIVKEDSNDGKEFKVLCAQRYDHAEHFPSLYEFPGGKVDQGETHAQALIRECREELGIQVALLPNETTASIGGTLAGAVPSSHSTNGLPSSAAAVGSPTPCYVFSHAPKPDKRLGGVVTFRLYFYWAQIVTPNTQISSDQAVIAPEPKALASQRIAWLSPKEMTGLAFCPGDEDIISQFQAGSLFPPKGST